MPDRKKQRDETRSHVRHTFSRQIFLKLSEPTNAARSPLQLWKKLRAPDKYAGRQVTCPGCQQKFSIPAAPAAVDDNAFVDDYEKRPTEKRSWRHPTRQSERPTIPSMTIQLHLDIPSMNSSNAPSRKIATRASLGLKVPT